MKPELHRPLAAAGLPRAGQEVLVDADAAECCALARRMGLPEVRSLSCRFRLTPLPAGAVLAEAVLGAEVVQTCVVSLEDFAAAVSERFVVCFVPAGAESSQLDPDAVDEIPYEDGVLDLGEATAEQLALALDPYPRAPGVVFSERSESDNANPFTGLGALRQRR
jgi:uncharacterized metal-binding protein YceD (DUF177 family)